MTLQTSRQAATLGNAPVQKGALRGSASAVDDAVRIKTSKAIEVSASVAFVFSGCVPLPRPQFVPEDAGDPVERGCRHTTLSVHEPDKNAVRHGGLSGDLTDRPAVEDQGGPQRVMWCVSRHWCESLRQHDTVSGRHRQCTVKTSTRECAVDAGTPSPCLTEDETQGGGDLGGRGQAKVSMTRVIGRHHEPVDL